MAFRADAAALARLETEAERTIRAELLRQRFLIVSAILAGETIKRLVPARKTLDIVTRLRGGMEEPLTRAIQGGLLIGAQRAATDLALASSFTLRNPMAERYLRTVAAERITAVTEHTRNVVRAILEVGVRNGATPRELADAVFRQAGGGGIFSEYRASMIARTEVGDAYITANLEMTRELGGDLGLTQEKRWLLADADTDSECTSAADDGWIPIDDTFSNGLDGPLAHPNCLCDLAYRVAS